MPEEHAKEFLPNLRNIPRYSTPTNVSDGHFVVFRTDTFVHDGWSVSRIVICNHTNKITSILPTISTSELIYTWKKHWFNDYLWFIPKHWLHLGIFRGKHRKWNFMGFLAIFLLSERKAIAIVLKSSLFLSKTNIGKYSFYMPEEVMLWSRLLRL